MHYQFAILLFSLLAAPKEFMKYMAVIAAFLRKREVQVYFSLGDWLVRGQTKA